MCVCSAFRSRGTSRALARLEASRGQLAKGQERFQSPCRISFRGAGRSRHTNPLSTLPTMTSQHFVLYSYRGIPCTSWTPGVRLCDKELTCDPPLCAVSAPTSRCRRSLLVVYGIFVKYVSRASISRVLMSGLTWHPYSCAWRSWLALALNFALVLLPEGVVQQPRAKAKLRFDDAFILQYFELPTMPFFSSSPNTYQLTETCRGAVTRL